MAEDVSTAEAQTITFSVKSSADQKFTLSVPDSLTVADVKQKLATPDYADVPADRQRLIYSGRVLKDQDTLASYKVKDGNTIHLVKQAASNQRQNPASQGSSAGVPAGAGTANTPGGVPSNIAAGTGNDPLAGLTGARYAGFAQMPGANMFGPDGGMGPPQGPEEMLNMLDNPMFQSQMNEALQNPHVIQMMQNNPMIRNNPMMRDMLNNPEMRRMMLDPQFIRQSMQMQRMMGGGDAGQGSMPAPGVTDTTPQEGENNNSNSNQAGGANPAQPPNPFAMFGQPGAQNQANPFAALFGGAGAGGMGANSTNPPAAASPGAAQPGSQPPDQQQQQTQPNPFASMLGGMPNAGQDGQQSNPLMNMAQQMMQNPEMMRMAMNSLGMGGVDAPQQGNGGAGAAPNAGGGMGGINPFAMMGGAPFGGMAPTQQDTRPPEEQYSEQLGQLNDMGFFDFNQNVRALRMSGGRVEGAVEMLLSGGI